MKKEDIKALSEGELTEKIYKMREEQTKLKLTHAVNPLENPGRIREVRKDIARLLTEQSARVK